MLRQIIFNGFESFEMGNHAFPMHFPWACAWITSKLESQNATASVLKSPVFDPICGPWFYPHSQAIFIHLFSMKILRTPFQLTSLSLSLNIWLVVWNIFLFFLTLGIIIPTDFHSIIFQRGGEKPPTRYTYSIYIWVCLKIGYIPNEIAI